MEKGFRLQSQVSLANNFVLEQLLASSFCYDLAGRKHIVTGGHLEDSADLLFYEEHGDPEAGDLLDLIKHLPLGYGGQPSGWFVNAEEFGFGHQCPADGQHLLLAAGEGS